MPSLRVVLVKPRVDGNVGAAARAMGNFGYQDLWMVEPCPLTDEAYKRAKHASSILDSARTVTSLERALEGVSLTVGTSGIVSPGEKHFLRIPVTPREMAEKVSGYGGTIALLFGPEDMGLSQEELMQCDLLVHVPTADEYPVLNLSHAVAVVLYELRMAGVRSTSPSKANELEREKLCEFFSDLLRAIDYPEFRREKTEIMFRRLMGRAVPTKWEFYTIMGVLADAAEMIRRGNDGRRGQGP